jgi:gamma-glutamyltranspeptidase / glutathione hydrolase
MQSPNVFNIKKSANPGAIAMPDIDAADAAEEILKDGGNAIDAAVAVGFTLAVTYPEAGNIGGGGFMTMVMNGRPHFLDYRECASAHAKERMYLDDRDGVIKGKSTVGVAAAGVPGTVRGYWEAHRRFGSLPWRRLLAPAIRLAEEGFVVNAQLIERREVMLDDYRNTNFLSYFGGMKRGESFRQPVLAGTLRRLAEYGADDFYLGQISGLLLAAMRNGGGIIDADDLRRYAPLWRTPLCASWRGRTVITAPPPSAGGIGLIQQLKMKDLLAEHFAGLPLNSAKYVHLLCEIAKQVFADRATYVGDPDFSDVPASGLLRDAYIARRAEAVNPAMQSDTAAVAHGMPESDETTHYSILDQWGNAVSNTTTLNAKFGCGVVVEGAGFLLNNGMDDFSIKPGTPNRFGIVGSAINGIAAGKRMASSMAPTILTKDGCVDIVIGTPGGSRIPTTIFQVLCNLFDHQLGLREAIAEMRLHHQLHPEKTIFWEPYSPVPEELGNKLAQYGYVFQSRFTNGDMQVIRVAEGGIEAASDPRARGVSRVLH